MPTNKDVTEFGIFEKEFLNYFEEGCHDLSIEFEERRKRFIKKLFIRSIASILSIAFLFVFPGLCYMLIAATILISAAIERETRLTKLNTKEFFVSLFTLHNLLNISLILFSVVMAYGFEYYGYVIIGDLYIAIALFAYSLQPIFIYRRHKQKVLATESMVLVTEIYISLKELIFSKLIKFFGDFKFKRIGAVSLVNIHKAPIMPDYDRYISEDLITGVFEDTRIEISEGMLIKEIGKEKIAMFRGMFVVMDISNSDLVLRNSFRGKTIIIESEKIDSEYLKKHYSEYEKLDLSEENEAKFEVLTTNKSEAKQLVTDALLIRIQRLSETISKAEQQIQHDDDKLMAYAHKICMKLGGLILSPFGSSNLDPLPIEKTDADISYDIESLNRSVQCCFYDDKVLLTIPYKKDLFEPNSIFQPAIIEEDIHVLYNVMRLTYEIIHCLLEEKAKPSFSFEKAIKKKV